MFFVKNSGLCSAQNGHLGLADHKFSCFDRRQDFAQILDAVRLHHGKCNLVVVLNVQSCLFISIL